MVALTSLILPSLILPVPRSPVGRPRKQPVDFIVCDGAEALVPVSEVRGDALETSRAAPSERDVDVIQAIVGVQSQKKSKYTTYSAHDRVLVLKAFKDKFGGNMAKTVRHFRNNPMYDASKKWDSRLRTSALG